MLQIGDASGIQSPLSFGGFGAMTRHLDRLREAVVEALEVIPRVSCMFWIACQRLVSVVLWHAMLQGIL